MSDDDQPDPFANAMLAIRRALADKLSRDPALLLKLLRQEALLEPDNEVFLQAIDLITAEMSEGPAVVLIESAITAGGGANPEGRVYIQEADGRLRPATGDDLRLAEDRFPGLLKNWSLPEHWD